MKSNKYWIERTAEEIWKAYNDIETRNKDLLSAYLKTSEDIQKELYKLSQKMNCTELTRSEMYKYRRLTNLKNNIKKRVSNLGNDTLEFGFKNMSKGYKQVYKSILTSLSIKNFDIPNERLIRQIIDNPWKTKYQATKSCFSESLWKDTNKLNTVINEVLSKGIIQGKTFTEMAIQVNNEMNKGFNVAHRLVRTETMHTLNMSSLNAYKDSRVVKKVQYYTAEDERTCESCSKYHLQIYDINEAPILPIHANCRCVLTPVVDLNEKRNDNTNKIEFIEAKNIKNANEYAKNVLKINAEYKGCDVVTANEWNRGLTDSFNKFPKLKDNFSFVGDCRERNKALKSDLIDYYFSRYKELNSGADESVLHELSENKASSYIRRHMKVSKDTFAESWSPKKDPFTSYKGVTVNKDWGKNSENFVKSLKDNVSVKFHPEGCDTIRSVLDHEIGHQLDDLLGIGKLPEVQEIFNSRTTEQITNEISKYSWKNKNPNRYSEMIAEAWSEYCNNPTPRGPAKKIGEIIEKEYIKKFGE